MLWPLVCVPVYIVLQLILVFRTLEDRWPIGDIVFGTAFFAGAQVLLFAFSVTICNAIKHYIDGLFFFTLCILLSVMMVYKYWDDITVRCSIHRSSTGHCCAPWGCSTQSFSSHMLTLTQIARRSRVLRWVESRRLGSQGSAPGTFWWRLRRGLVLRRAVPHAPAAPRLPLELLRRWRTRCARRYTIPGVQDGWRRERSEPRWWRWWRAAVRRRAAGGRQERWAGIPATKRGAVLSGHGIG